MEYSLLSGLMWRTLSTVLVARVYLENVVMEACQLCPVGDTYDGRVR